jgi:hypothetical protein
VPDCQLTNIVKAAYGLDPAIVARVDIAARRATALETSPAHVYWGDIPNRRFDAATPAAGSAACRSESDAQRFLPTRSLRLRMGGHLPSLGQARGRAAGDFPGPFARTRRCSSVASNLVAISERRWLTTSCTSSSMFLGTEGPDVLHLVGEDGILQRDVWHGKRAGLKPGFIRFYLKHPANPVILA